MPSAPNTASSMIVRTATNPTYTIYNLGQNQILLGQDIITSSQLGSDFNFAGPGAVTLNFVGPTLDLWVSAPSTIFVGPFSFPVNLFVVYNINGNTITNSNTWGVIGQEWQVQGFGDFFDGDQADMLTRNVSNNTATYLAYNTENNHFNGVITAAVVGANFNTAGLGTYFIFSFPLSTPSAQLMVLSDGAGGLWAYAYSKGALVNDPSQVFATIGNGQDWEVLGFGHFNSQFGLNMIVRNIDPASANFQQVWIYDVVQTATGNYTAQLSTAVSPGQTQAGILGAIGLEWKVAGIAPVNPPSLDPFTLIGTNDLVMRNTNTGALQVYDIQADTLTGSAALTPPASNPIAATSTVGGMATDFSAPASGSTSQLVQAMAGFGDGSGAAESLNAGPLSAETSQQPLLTTPQHA
jgi:hypothetical protein